MYIIYLTIETIDEYIQILFTTSGGAYKGQAGATTPFSNFFNFFFIILHLIFFKYFKLFIFFKLNNIIFKINKN